MLLTGHCLRLNWCSQRRSWRLSDGQGGCLGFLRTIYQSGGKHLDELYLGRDCADEIDAWNGKDFTYGQDCYLQVSAG